MDSEKEGRSMTQNSELVSVGSELALEQRRPALGVGEHTQARKHGGGPQVGIVRPERPSLCILGTGDAIESLLALRRHSGSQLPSARGAQRAETLHHGRRGPPQALNAPGDTSLVF
jgi:hypothetical protein